MSSNTAEKIENKNIKLILDIINRSGIAVSIWMLFVPVLYSLSIVIAIIIPVISLIVYRLLRGVVKIDEIDRENYTIAGGLIVPGLALVIRTSYDFEIYDYSNVLLPSLAISIVFLIIMILGNKEFSFRKKDSYIIISIMMFFSFLYGASSIIFINCYYDKYITEIFTVNIVSKKSKTKGQNYKVEVSPWGEWTENEKISLDKDLYYQVGVGDKVNIVLCKGKFDIPWFYVDDLK